MKKYLMLMIIALQFVSITEGQTVKRRIMSYNLLNYPGSTAITYRNGYFRKTMEYINPDLLVVGELTSNPGAVQNMNTFRDSVMNFYHANKYSAGTIVTSGSNTNDTYNAVYYKPELFEYLGAKAYPTALRDISEFTLRNIETNDTFKIFSVHLKASTGTDNEAARAAEVDSLRKVTNSLPEGTNFMVVGDFNLYKSTEAAFVKLLAVGGVDGNFNDPLPFMTGAWQDNTAYAKYHTQSTRKRSFDGGATGGLDDRFDLILFSNAIKNPGGMTYIDSSLVAVGNDGNHLNDSINRLPNTAVPDSIANALHYTSDHLPVYEEFSFVIPPVPVELSSFIGVSENGKVLLSWETSNETNNYGFEIERKIISDKNEYGNFTKVGFVKGEVSSNYRKEYRFVDNAEGVLKYRLKQIDVNGNYKYFNEVTVSNNAVSDFVLFQNYPNPFNPLTRIKFEAVQEGVVNLSIYNATGELVKELINGSVTKGAHEVIVDLSGQASGVYFYSLRQGTNVITKNMVYLK